MSKSNSREVHGSAAPREYHRRSMNLHPLSFATRLVAVVLPLALASVASAQSPLGPGIDAPASRIPAPSKDAQPGMSADIFYRLLLGDVALQRGEPALAARAYLDVASETRDVRLARRATEIAIASRQRGLAEDSAKLWSSLDPGAERPKQILAALHAGAATRDLPSPGPEDELKGRLQRLLSDAAVSGQGVGEIFVQLNALFAQQSDKRAVLLLIRDLAQPYPKSAEAHFAIALAAFNAGADDANYMNEALSEVDRALELRPDWERAALLKAEILVRVASVDRAAEFLKSFLAKQPESKAAAGALAQFYVEQKRYAEAREILQQLWDKEPEARELEFGVAAIALQMKDYATAERLLNDLKKAGFGQPGAIDLYLAQVAEETKHYDLAIERYKAVTEGDRAWLAKLRIGVMLGKQGKVDEAKRWYADLPAVTPEQRVQVRQSEAQMLRDIGDVKGAYRVLTQGLNEQPDAPDLVYDLAMVAEKLDRLDEAESRLKQLVELRPDDAQALNALGYTLVDRTSRTSEGYALIEKALKIAPNDPFILDSMGWALYRLGRLDEAEQYLKRALAERPDPEIAAHLGEVLWTKGDRDSARALWKAQLESDPDNAVLKETVRRLQR